MSKVIKIRGDGQLTLPVEIRKQAGLQPSDTLYSFVDKSGVIHLVPKAATDQNQAYFWTGQWQEGEEEANKNLSYRQSKDFNNIESLLEELESD